MNNIFAVYKPVGPSSNQMLSRIKKVLNIKKVGHAGTLDPLAQGILVVAVGRAYTKQLPEIVKKEKEYIAKIRLGQTSTTDDEEGEKKIIIENEPKNINLNTINNILNDFKGIIEQIPPIFSAIKMNGQAAYKLARKGTDIKMRAREAEIKDIELLDYNWPYLTIRAVTGPGVYIRSLARDIGERLKTGGHLNELERTRVGQYSKEKALSLKDIASLKLDI